jgi:hypothetical protein
VKNWRQKARSSARGFVCLSRLVAGEERDVEVIVAMTQTRCFLRGFGRVRCAFVALKPSFGLIY